MTVWVALASFFGAVVGAAVPAIVALRGQHQQARAEWSQRLDRAISALTSGDAATREIGKELLADLIQSDLGSAGDRDLARRVMRSALNARGSEVDATSRSRDNGNDQLEES